MSNIPEQAATPEENNLELWQMLYQTDKNQVRPIKGKTYQGDSPKPYYLIEKCTAMFGACGIGWGYRIVEHGFNEFKFDIPVGSDGKTIERTMINHWCIVEFWYKWKGEKSEPIQQFGGTQAAYISGQGKPVFDEDVTKKSVTDALVKCMSCIGIAGDIFSGRWDDSKYHQEQQEQQQRQQAQQQQQQQQQPRDVTPVQAAAPANASPALAAQQQAAYNAQIEQALRDIQIAENTERLREIAAYFHGSAKYEMIKKAIVAKSDLEGWSK